MPKISTDSIMREIRELHASGGPGDFEDLLDLIMRLDILLQNGAALPSEWCAQRVWREKYEKDVPEAMEEIFGKPGDPDAL